MSDEEWRSLRGVRAWLEDRGLFVEKTSDDACVRFKCTKVGFPYVLLVCPADAQQSGSVEDSCSPRACYDKEKWTSDSYRVISTIWEREESRVTRVDVCSPNSRQAKYDALAFYDMTGFGDQEFGDQESGGESHESPFPCSHCVHVLHYHVHYHVNPENAMPNPPHLSTYDTMATSSSTGK
jgi:hypothetical protein